MKQGTSTVTSHIIFIVICGIGAVVYYNSLVQLLELAWHSELYDHIPIIPFISLGIVIFGRKRIFADVSRDWIGGTALLGLGLGALLTAKWVNCLNQNDCLALAVSGGLLWTIGGFLIAYGTRAFKEAMFPLLFLIFVIPVPKFILDSFIESLQIGSTNAADMIFGLTSVPVHREGFTFALPGITIEVAQQCSGIRSSIALIITSVLAGYLFLQKAWSRVILVLSFFPITVFKNGMRIVTLSLLASYVDTRFITGSWLHKSGGIPFFGVGLALMAPVLCSLMKAEKRKASHQSSVISEQ